MKLKDKLFIIIVILGLVVFGVQKIWPGDKEENKERLTKMTIGETVITVGVVDDEEERYQGLSGIESLADDRGLLFVFETAGQHTFVMRGMKFDLDFIFINDNQVVDLAKNVAFEYQGEVKGAVDYDQVLEVKAGFVDLHKIEIGEGVKRED